MNLQKYNWWMVSALTLIPLIGVFGTLLYSVNNITSGTDALGEVTVRISKNSNVVNGHGADTDIVKASVLAFINALNKLQQNPDLSSTKKRGV